MITITAATPGTTTALAISETEHKSSAGGTAELPGVMKRVRVCVDCGVYTGYTVLSGEIRGPSTIVFNGFTSVLFPSSPIFRNFPALTIFPNHKYAYSPLAPEFHQIIRYRVGLSTEAVEMRNGYGWYDGAGAVRIQSGAGNKRDPHAI